MLLRMAYFRSAHLKIEWANKHIGELAAVFQRFLKSDFYRLGLDEQSDGSYVLAFESQMPVPGDISMLIGDAIHNLRSALDHVAYEIVADTGRKPSRHVAFPFAKSRQELIDAIKGGEVETAAGKTLVDLIVDTVRPYKGGNDALYAIRALDIGDKHKLLIPTVSVIGIRGVSGSGDGIKFRDLGFAVGEGGKVNAIGMRGTVKITDKGEPVFEVRFAKDQPLEGQPVLPTLHQLSQLVAGVVETIEKGYTPPGP